MFTIAPSPVHKTLDFHRKKGSHTALASNATPLFCEKVLLGSNHLKRDRGAQVVTQANRRLVRTGSLDRAGDLDLALVERTETGRRNRVGDVAGLDRAEQT